MRNERVARAAAAAIAVVLWGCQARTGGTGDPGSSGPQGPRGCDGLAAGETSGLTVTVTVAPPRNGTFFAPGERVAATVRFADRCGSLRAADLGTAQLFLYGPRRTASTRTATKLLNCVVDRNDPDRQHHFLDMRAPKFLDAALRSLSEDAAGTIAFTSAPVTDEEPGTYTLAVWAKSLDEREQELELAELQIATATREELASGAVASSRCHDCHGVPRSAKMSMHHAHPSPLSPGGDWALDLFPVASCQACHNLDGYSAQPVVRKVHGLHRGRNQLAAGVAHPEYGLSTDVTLVDYLDVGFPAMPHGERDCQACHADDRWEERPTRLACGTCHDNLFFDSGTLDPVRVFGKPSWGVSCSDDPSCAGFGNFAVCNTGTGECERTTHPQQANDSQCTVCHVAGGLSPVGDRHEVYQRTRVRHLQLEDVVLYASGVDLATTCVPGGAPKACGTGPGGAVQIRSADGSQPGDVLKLRFTLTTGDGTPVTELRTSTPLSATLLLAGPSDDPQRVFGPTTMKSFGTFTCVTPDTVNNKICLGGVYDYALPKSHASAAGATGEFPSYALAPYNTVPGAPAGTPSSRINMPGTYTLWIYVNEAFSSPESFRDAGNAFVHFRAGADGPIQPRSAVMKSGCNSCHVNVQAHGGGRQQEVGLCLTCHTRGAVDRSLLTTGTSCQQNADCRLFAAGYEACIPSPLPTALPLPDPLPSPSPAPWPNTCVLVADPTPTQPIDMAIMAHQIHFARLLGGYSTRDFGVSPGKLQYLANSNIIADLSEGLLPVDVRNCRVCHVDSGEACSASVPCDVGQECVGGSCVNRAWKTASSRVCISCHDTEASWGHAQLNTFGAIETCTVCHGEDDELSAERVHEVADPWVPPYPREP